MEAARRKVSMMNIHPALEELVDKIMPDGSLPLTLADFLKRDEALTGTASYLVDKPLKKGQAIYIIYYLKIMLKVKTLVEQEKTAKETLPPYLNKELWRLKGQLEKIHVNASMLIAQLFGMLHDMVDPDPIVNEGEMADLPSAKDYAEAEAIADMFLAASLFNPRVFELSR